MQLATMCDNEVANVALIADDIEKIDHTLELIEKHPAAVTLDKTEQIIHSLAIYSSVASTHVLH